MDYGKIAPGRDLPLDINVVIEIPMGGEPVKYEVDKTSGALVVDRFLHVAMRYPANYGFVPNTLADDGDPIDALVICPTPVIPGAIVRCRPIGALLMEDENGLDEKIVTVPVDRLHPYYRQVRSIHDLPEILRDQVAHFFSHYKDLEPGKWVRVSRWQGPDFAGEQIMRAVARFGRNRSEGRLLD